MPVRRWALITAVGCTVACSPPEFQNSQATAEVLSHEVLTALERHDEYRLRALAISEVEFEQRVWPALPAALPERNMPWSYVWMDLRQKSDSTLQRTLRAYGGRHYELVEVKFEGTTTTHGSYQVRRDSRLIVRDASGRRQELRIVGSMIAGAEGWKVFSYVADE